MKNVTDSLAKNTLLLAAGNILTKGLSFIMVPFFSRWLSTSDYGSFDLFCTYVSLMIPLINLATGEAVFRFSMEKGVNDEDKSKFISNGFAIVSINSIVVACILFIVRSITGWELALPFIFLLLGELYNTFFQAYLRALKKLNIYSFVSAISTVFIFVFVTVLVKVFEFGLKGMILGYALGYILGDLIIAFIGRFSRYFSIRKIEKKEILHLIKYSYPLIPNSVSWWIINVSDRFVIKQVMGTVANGIYAISNKVPAICSAVFSVFNISWQQTATEIVENGDTSETEKYFNEVFNSMLSILLTICIGILSVNFFLFSFIFDQRYFTGRLYSPILITAIIFMMLAQYFGGIQISLKMPKENGITTFIGAIVNVLINVFAINYFGLYAAAVSTLISYIVICVLRLKKLTNIVHLNINSKSVVLIVLYLYFFAASFWVESAILNWLNFMAAVAIFIIANRSFIIKLLRRVFSK